MSAAALAAPVRRYPAFHFIPYDLLKVIHSVALPYRQRLEVVGETSWSSYEWCLIDADGKVIKYSNVGYIAASIALMRGLLDYHADLVEDADTERRSLRTVNAQLFGVLEDAELALAEKLRRLGADPQASAVYRRIGEVLKTAGGQS